MRRLGGSALGTIESRLDNNDEAVVARGWPQEVRKLLFEANEAASVLRSERHALVARAAELERRLQSAGATIAELKKQVAAHERGRRQAAPPARRPDQHWLHEVTDRTATALRSGQELAQSLVERAQQRAAEMERVAVREAATIRKRAEAQAAKVLNMAQYDAEGLLHGAQASAEELLGAAHKHREEIVADLRRREETLLGEIERLERGRLELLETYASIRRPVDEAIRALERGSERQPMFGDSPLVARIRNARPARGKRPAAAT